MDKFEKIIKVSLNVFLTSLVILAIIFIPYDIYNGVINDESNRYELLSKELELNEDEMIVERQENDLYKVATDKGVFKVVFEGDGKEMKIHKIIQIN